jgi:hypothetical protein
MSFPDLPPPPNYNGWGRNICRAYDILEGTYTTALRLLQQDTDRFRLELHADTICTETIPLLQALESDDDISGQLPGQWLDEVASLFGQVVKELRTAQEYSQEQCVIFCFSIDP